MYAPISNSIPFLTIARHHGIDYGTVLSCADWHTQESRKHTYWTLEAWHKMVRHKNGAPAQFDIIETVARLKNAGPV